MKKALWFISIAAVVVLVGGGASALADKPGFTCSGGTDAAPVVIPGSAGPYGNVTVTGICRFDGDVTINGSLTVADGASLNANGPNHATQTPFKFAHVTINGNVKVGTGAVLGLGNYGPPGILTNTVVNGNINANQPLDLYLSGITVHGSVVSNGGGPGTTEFLNFPTKDDIIDGNLIVQGWTGGWIGLVRDVVGGNVIFSNNSSVITDDGSAPPDSDSSEVMTNTVGGNLICQSNSPVAQVNPDDNGQPNTVSGNKVGECSAAGI